jgi:hypothetical protein
MVESTISREQWKYEENKVKKERDFLFVYLIESIHWRFPFLLSLITLYKLLSIG